MDPAPEDVILTMCDYLRKYTELKDKPQDLNDYFHMRNSILPSVAGVADVIENQIKLIKTRK